MGMHLTPEQIADLVARGAVIGPVASLPAADGGAVQTGGASKEKAKGKQAKKTVGNMTAPERSYSELLDERIRAGEVLRWWYEAIQLRIAGRTTYLVDFMVLLSDLSIEMVEIKGKHLWHASVVKFKAARDLYPLFTFRMMQWKAKRWREITVDRKPKPK